MIKLFWNTHNQVLPKPGEINTENARNYKWGLYHKHSSNEWILEVLSGLKYKKIESEKDLAKEDTLVIVDSSIDKKNEYYSKLKLICSKIFLFHLGDESGIYNLNSIYEKCSHVWRTFCSNKYFLNKKVSCFALGYKSGLIYEKGQSRRKYKWSFIGTPHKSSRHDLLFQLSDIKPSFSYKTRKFDQKIMDIEQMSKVLSSTDFVPCPNGFVHPETYRLYEALESKCIPIVEETYKYYDRLFPNNPFLKVNRWVEAKSIIKEWESHKVEEKRQECETWWSNYKNQLQEQIKTKVN